MKDELKRLIEDRNDAEADLDHLYDELREVEDRLGPEHENYDEWEDLFIEINDMENHISYLTAVISSIEAGYDE